MKSYAIARRNTLAGSTTREVVVDFGRPDFDADDYDGPLEADYEPDPDLVLRARVRLFGLDPARFEAFDQLQAKLGGITDAKAKLAELDRVRHTGARLLADLVASWDLCADDGEPVPPTAKAIAAAYDLSEIVTLILELARAASSVPLGKTSPSSAA